MPHREVMKLVCRPGLFHVHIDFLRFLFLTEFHRWSSYNFLWPVFHEVSSFLTLRLNNVLVKLFSFFSLLTDPWMNMMICSLLCLPRWTSFFGSYTTTRENCVNEAVKIFHLAWCTTSCFSWDGNQLIVLTAHATFFIRQESGYPRGPVYKVIVFLSATRSNQELRSVDVDPLCLNLEVCFRKAYSLIWNASFLC